MTLNVKYSPDGDVIVDGKKLSDEHVRALMASLLRTGRVDEYLSPAGVPATIDGWCARIGACHEAGDKDGVITAFAGLCHAVMAEVKAGPDAGPVSGRVPTTKNLGPALRGGARVVSEFPLEAHNGRRDPKELTGRAQTVELQDRLLGVFITCGDVTRRSLGHLAQESEGWVGGLLEAIAPAEPKNPRLREAAAPMHLYVDEPVERGLDTRRTSMRARGEGAAQATEEVMEGARTEARAELKSKLDERFAELLK